MTDDYEPLNFDIPDKDLMCISIDENAFNQDQSWKMYFDGASNALGHGIGAILMSLNESHYPFIARLNFDCINNIAEYKACAIGL